MADFNYSLLCKNIYVGDLCYFFQFFLAKEMFFFPIGDNSYQNLSEKYKDSLH